MLYTPQNAENDLGVAERRARRRLHPNSLIFININDLNKGIVFNISEDGLALSAGMVLPDSHLPAMQIQFPGSADWAVVIGQVVWKSKSKKEAGIQFVGLKEEARQEIKKWMASEATTGELGLEPRAPIRDPKQETSRGREGWIFSGASLGPSLPDPCEPSIGSTKDGQQRIESWIQETKTPQEEYRALSATANDAGKSSTPERLYSRIFAEEPLESISAARPSNSSLEESEKVVKKRAKQEMQVMPGNRHRHELSAHATDRRAHKRTRIVPLGYLQLGESNGGIALNVSEGGLAITAAVVLVHNDLPKIRLQFPDCSDSIEASGQIVWRSESKREAGVRFVGLSEQSRQQITDWISSQAGGEPYRESASPRILLDPQQALGEVNIHTPQILIPETASPGAAVEPLVQIMNTSAASQTPLDLIPDAIASNKRVLVPKIRVRAKEWRANLGGRSRNLRRIAAAAGLIGLITFSVERIASERNAGNNLLAAIARKTEVTSGTVQGESGPLRSGSTGATTSGLEKMRPQTRRAEPVAEEKRQSIPGPSPRISIRQAGVRERPAASSIHDRPNHPLENAPVPSQKAKEPLVTATSPMSRPVRPTQPQGVGNVPATPPQLETNLTSPLNSDSGLSASVLPVGLKKNESSPLPPKESPVNTTGLVAIRTDPYPSIRVPSKRGSKKGVQGTSLQLGHLISRVEPIYPEVAKQQGIEGIVRIHAIISRNGSVETLMSIDGPALLVPVATAAVRQWRFTETLLGGQPVETEEDVAVTFRLSKEGTSKK
jgi:hypothetical protein